MTDLSDLLRSLLSVTPEEIAERIPQSDFKEIVIQENNQAIIAMEKGEGHEIAHSLDQIITWEVAFKKKLTDCLSASQDPPVDQQILEHIIDLLGIVNNQRLLLVNQFSEWIINSFEQANVLGALNSQQSEEKVRKIEDVVRITCDHFRSIDDPQDLHLTGVVSDTIEAIENSIEMAKDMLEETKAGDPFPRIRLG